MLSGVVLVQAEVPTAAAQMPKGAVRNAPVVVAATPVMAPVGVGSHPAAHSTSGQYPMPQNSSVGLPQPVRSTGNVNLQRPTTWFGSDTFEEHQYVSVRGAQADPKTHKDAGQYYETYFTAPNQYGIMSEADFDAATMCAKLDGADPFGELLGRSSAQMVLDSGVQGRVDEAVAIRRANCISFIVSCAIPVLTCPADNVKACCLLTDACRGKPEQLNQTANCCEDAITERLRSAAEARTLRLHEDCIVFERKEHSNELVRSWLCRDQYGHRHSHTVLQTASVPSLKLSIPLKHAKVMLVPRRALGVPRAFREDMCVSLCLDPCLMPADSSSAVVVRVGEGIKTVVAVVECGKRSNAEVFVAACDRAIKAAPPDSPELSAAYSNWFVSRLRATGTMTGCVPRPPGNLSMERELIRASGKASVPFVKHIGPLPPGGVEVRMESRRVEYFSGDRGPPPNATEFGRTVMDYKVKVDGTSWLEITKKGILYRPWIESPFASALHAGDKLVSITDVTVDAHVDNALMYTSYLNRIKARYEFHNGNNASTAPPGSLSYLYWTEYMKVESRQPYFQPNYLITVLTPSGGMLTELGLAPNAGKPPMIEQPTPIASGLGLVAGDVIVQAIILGAPLDTTVMDSSQLLAAAASVAGPVSLTVLQSTRVASLEHPISWPRAKPKWKVAMEEGRFAEAVELLTTAIQKNETHKYRSARTVGQNYYDRSDAYASLGKWEESLEDASSCIKNMPKSGIGYACKGIALERLGRHHDAVFVYQLGIINGIEVEPSLKATLTKGLTRAKKQAEGQRGRV